MAAALDEIISELSEAEPRERIELLIDFAKSLPPLPERLESLKDATHRVEECQSPVYLFVESEDGGRKARLYADAPIESPSVRGFVSILVQGLDGTTPETIRAVPMDLVQRAGLEEILGMLRIRGLTAVLHRVKAGVAKAAAAAH
ncbi:MAG: SufE family protein [Isosphaeraceae bacterium]|nr:SufE family protein [Isosphaeraceae bacterium]